LYDAGGPPGPGFGKNASVKVQVTSTTSSIPTTKTYNIHITNRVYSNLKPELKTIKTGVFPINIWSRQPSIVRGLLPGSLANTTIYRTDKTIPF
jgi:hypothetical protein